MITGPCLVLEGWLKLSVTEGEPRSGTLALTDSAAFRFLWAGTGGLLLCFLSSVELLRPRDDIRVPAVALTLEPVLKPSGVFERESPFSAEPWVVRGGGRESASERELNDSGPETTDSRGVAIASECGSRDFTALRSSSVFCARSFAKMSALACAAPAVCCN